MTTTGMDRRNLIVGLVLVGLGMGLAVAATIAHLAWALPLSELPARPGMIDGEILVAIGVLVLCGRRVTDRVSRFGGREAAASLRLARGSALSR